MDGHEYGLLLPNQNHLLLRTRDGSVEQIPSQHLIVLFQYGDNDNREFCALALVYADTVGQAHIFKHICGILDLFAVQEPDQYGCIVSSVFLDRSDYSDFTIGDFSLVAVLDDTISLTENHASTLYFSFPQIAWICDLTDLFVQPIGANGSFLTVR